MCGERPPRSTVNATNNNNLVQRGELLLGSLRVVHIKQARNVVHVLAALSLDDGLLTAADGREVALLLSERGREHEQQLPRDRSVLRGNALPRQTAQRLHIDAIALQEAFVFCDILISITRGKHENARILGRL